MFKVNNKDIRTMPTMLTLNIFHTMFQCLFVNFEQVNANADFTTYVLCNVQKAAGLFKYV